MKPLLATTACIITATVVCARISNDEINSLRTQPAAQSEAVEASANLATLNEFSPSAYGAIGATTLALLIAARRHEGQR